MKRKMVENRIDNLELIHAIKARPALWNLNCKENAERKARKEAWFEVCLELIPNFFERKKSEAEGIIKAMQFKWKNLRDSYARNRRLMACQKRTGKGKLVKEYTYSKHLTFLENFVLPIEQVKIKHGNKNTNSLASSSSEEPQKLRRSSIKREPRNFECFETYNDSIEFEEVIPFEENMIEIKDDCEEMEDENDPLSREEEISDKQEDSTLMNYIDQQQNQLYKQMNHSQIANNGNQLLLTDSQEDNDDMQFFKSLLPSLQTLQMDEKLNFRIEVMKLVSKFISTNK